MSYKSHSTCNNDWFSTVIHSKIKFFVALWYAEQKKQKVSEIKSGLDDAEALVLNLLKFLAFLFIYYCISICRTVNTDTTAFYFHQIRKMDLEARSLQPTVKAMLLAKLREYKSDLNNLKSELKRITSANSNNKTREDLLELGMADTLAVFYFLCLSFFLLVDVL